MKTMTVWYGNAVVCVKLGKEEIGLKKSSSDTDALAYACT